MPSLRPLLPVLAVLLLAAAGCFHYAPSGTAPTLESGAAVRMHLDPPRSFDVSGFTAHEVHRVDGSVVERAADGWVIAAGTLHASQDNRFAAAAYPLTIAAEDVGRVEVRTFSRWRSVAAGVLGAVAIFFVSEAMQGSSSSGDGDPPPTGPRILIPLP
jgi:hypothetical protein